MFHELKTSKIPEHLKPEDFTFLFAQYCESAQNQEAPLSDDRLAETMHLITLLREHHSDFLSGIDIFRLATGCLALIRADSAGDERVVGLLSDALEIIARRLKLEPVSEPAAETDDFEQLGLTLLTLSNEILERAPELWLVNSGAVSELIKFSLQKAQDLACAEVVDLIKSLAKALDKRIFQGRSEVLEKFEILAQSALDRLGEVSVQEARIFLESLAEIGKIRYPLSANIICRVTLLLASKIPNKRERLQAALPVLDRVEDPEFIYPVLASLLKDTISEEPVIPSQVCASELFQDAFATLPTLSNDGCLIMFRFLFAYARSYVTSESTLNEILSAVHDAASKENTTKTSLINLFNGFKEYVEFLRTEKPGYIDHAMTAAVLKYMVRLVEINAGQDETLKLWEIYHATCKNFLVSLNASSIAPLFAQSIGLAILGYAESFQQMIRSIGFDIANDDLDKEVIRLMSSPFRLRGKFTPESANQMTYMLPGFLEDALIEAVKLARLEDRQLRRSIVDFAKSVDEIPIRLEVKRPFEFLTQTSSTLALLSEYDIHVAIFLLKTYHTFGLHSLAKSSSKIEVELEELGAALPVILRFCGDLNFTHELVSVLLAKTEPTLKENSDTDDLSPDRIVRRALGAIAILAYNQDSSRKDYLNEQAGKSLDHLVEALSSLDDIAHGEWVLRDLTDLIVFALPRFEVLSEMSKQSVSSLFVWMMDSDISLAYPLIFGADKRNFWYGKFAVFFHGYQQPSAITRDDFDGLLTFFDYLFARKSKMNLGNLPINCIILIMNVCSRVLLLGTYTGFWSDDSLRDQGERVAKLLFNNLKNLKPEGLVQFFEESFQLMNNLVDGDSKRFVWGKIRQHVMQLVFIYYTFKRLGLAGEARQFATKFGSAIAWLADKILPQTLEPEQVEAFAQRAFWGGEESKLNNMFAFILQVSGICIDLEGDHKQTVEGFVAKAAEFTRADNRVAQDLTNIVNARIRSTGYRVKIIEGCKFGTLSVDLMVVVSNAAGEEVLRVLVDVDGPSHTGFRRLSDSFKMWYLKETEGLNLLRIDLACQGDNDRRLYIAQKITEYLVNSLNQPHIQSYDW